MRKPALNDHPIHDLIRERWSPRAFADRGVEPAVLASLFEAARWAPSSYNEQPWAFLVARREEAEAYGRLLACLVPGNQEWAQHAPVLAISAAKMTYEKGGKPNRHAFHDLGQAVTTLTVEATARGLVLHQMGGFDLAASREKNAIPEGWEPVTAIAIGYPADPDSLADDVREREAAPRQRKPLSDFVFTGGWGEPAKLG